MAEALATVTPALTRATPARPPAAQLRMALYQHAFNPARTATSDEATARVLTWAEQASLPLARLADPIVLRAALDGSRAAANTITRKRAVFHGALGYAVEAGLLELQPGRLDQMAGPDIQLSPAASNSTIVTLPSPASAAGSCRHLRTIIPPAGTAAAGLPRRLLDKSSKTAYYIEQKIRTERDKTTKGKK